jgi:hypothetical protein
MHEELKKFLILLKATTVTGLCDVEAPTFSRQSAHR